MTTHRWPGIGRVGWLAAGLSLPGLGWGQPVAPAPAPALVVDATEAVPDPGPSSFAGGTFRAPEGGTLTVNQRTLLRNGRPWLPVMGEFHYSRVPPQRWEEEILKMKAGGVQIVATYVFWIHHEEIEGQFDWSGCRDLRRFVELCGKLGMGVQLRIGPWAHGEARNGGFPDWLLSNVPGDQLRRNTPAFMTPVRRFYDEIGRQVRGCLWKDGGPVLGVQLENEYAARGPHAGEEYLLALKQLAIEAGLDVPLYCVTGWDNAVVPQDAVLPVYGGYMDAPWDESRGQLPPSEVYAFRFASRIAGDMGMMGDKNREAPAGLPSDRETTPFLTAEMGGGVQVTYHRRPVIEADDVAAMVPVMLGSGVNLYGSYMFHGGENPRGRLTTLQESQATNYPNDVPEKSYDFGAPLGEFGQERTSFRRLKLFNYFLNDFGDRLAPLVVRPPAVRPQGPADSSVPRFSVRTNGADGFVFWNNYRRYYPLPAWAGVQIAIRLPHEELRVPRNPVTIPAGAYFIWPFNLDLGGSKLKYSTAQLFTRLTSSGSDTYVFLAIPGIEPEFAFDAATTEIRGTSGRVVEDNGLRLVEGLVPGLSPAIVLQTKAGREVRIVLVSREQAESAWKIEIDGREHLLITAHQVYSDRSHIRLQSIGNPKFDFVILPEVSRRLRGTAEILAGPAVDGRSSFTASVPERILAVHATRLQDAGAAAPVRLGPSFSWRKDAVATVPEDSAWAHAAKWQLALPSKLPADLAEEFLEVNYVGDVARVLVNGRLLEDDFFKGPSWSVGLDRFKAELSESPLELDILPLRKDAPIFLEKRYWPQFPQAGQVAELRSIALVPEYQLSIDTGPGESTDR